MILNICINYCSNNETEGYLHALAELDGLDGLRVLVVDNSPREKAFEMPAALANGPFELLSLPENPGYFGAAAEGLRHYLAGSPLPDWVIVSNVDIRPASKDFLARIEAYGGQPDLAVLAPGIHSSFTSSNQNPFMIQRPRPLRMHFYRFLYCSWVLTALYVQMSRLVRRSGGKSSAGTGILPAAPGGPEGIYAAHGACFILSQAFFRRGGTLSYPCFLFGEEIFIAEQVRKLNMGCTLDEDVKIIHEEHVSTGTALKKNMLRYAQEAASFCAKSYFPLWG